MTLRDSTPVTEEAKRRLLAEPGDPLVHVEWRTPVPFLRLAAGPARTPGTITLAPYAAAGWTDDAIPLTPWRVTPGTRTTVGLGAEWLGVFRVEAGYGLQSHNAHVAFDVARDFWDIL